MKHKIIAAALAATLLGGSIAYAQNSTQAAPAAPPPPPMHGPMLGADADKDGAVTRAELLADIDARFAKVDTNKDGKITREERIAAFKKMREERRADGDRHGRWGRHGRHGHGFGMRGPGGPGGPGMGMRPDANGDGVVTLEEQRAQALKPFTYMDRNNDGKVDQAERDQLRDVMMAMRGPGPRFGHGRGFGPPLPTDDMPPPPAVAPTAPGGN